MNRTPKVKIAAARMIASKAVHVPVSEVRRPFPAWVDSGEGGVSLSAAAVLPRVRDGLVLRVVGRTKPATVEKKSSHGCRFC